MLSIERALNRYTDEVLSGNSECLASIAAEVNDSDRQEFIESALLIRALYVQKQKNRFERIFERVNQRKVELYDSMPQAVDFRGKGDDEAIALIESIFSEEFCGDDK